MTKQILVGLLGLTVVVAVASPPPKQTFFALSEFTMTGPNGTLRTVQIAITSGDRQACEARLAGFRYGQSKSAAAGHARKGREVCLTTLPPELKGISDQRPIPEAYYITRTHQLKSGEDTHVDVMYGFDLSDPEAICSFLTDRYRTKYKDARCVPPAR